MKQTLTYCCAVMALCLFIACGGKQTNDQPYNKGIHIIPAPRSLVQNEGVFTLTNGTTLHASEEADVQTVAAFFAAKLQTATGYTLKTDGNTEAADGIKLLLTSSSPAADVEGYALDVTPAGVTVTASTPQGLFYGMQTLLQLLPAEVESQKVVKNIAWTAPAVTISDAPRFGYRGIHLDPCRRFMPVEAIKKQLDVLALFKINRLHWHLTEDQGWRIEIKQYPELTTVGATRTDGEGTTHDGFYTQDEVREVVAYAAERFITVVPEIELPGHAMAAIAAYPSLSCTGDTVTPRIVWGVEDIVFCAGKEETFTFLENVIDEVVALFPGEYFHIGGDECPKVYWKNCRFCQERIRKEGLHAKDGHSAEERLQSYFVQRAEKMLAKHGKRIIGWDEILEGGLAPTATVMSWRGEEGGIAAAGMGHDVIMTPSSAGMYINQYQGDSKIEPVTIGGYSTLEKVYAYNPVPDVLTQTGKAQHVLGVQCNTWAEYIYNEDLRESCIYPRILALSEIAWSDLDRKDYNDFIENRLDNALVRLDGHNINYHIPQPEQPNGSCNFVAFTDSVSLPFQTTRPVTIVYTLDGSEPSARSTVYTAPITFTQSGVLKIRSLIASGKMSPVRTITVEKQDFSPAADVNTITTAGLTLETTPGYFLRVSDIPETAAWKVSDIHSLSVLPRAEDIKDPSMWHVSPFAAIATGYISIPADDVYYFSSDNEEVWLDGALLISNEGEVKRFSRHDRSVALAAGLHPIKVVFLGHIIGGWPSNWGNGNVSFRRAGDSAFTSVKPAMLFH